MVDNVELMKCFRKYVRLEEDLLRLADYIPLTPNLDAPNYEFPSPQVAEFCYDCGSWLETMMEQLINHPTFDDFPDIQQHRTNLNIETYRIVFNKKLGFETGGWRMNPGCDEIMPFKEWAENKNPDWFRIYSREKHNRLELEKQCTMKHAVMMFTAMTMVLKHFICPSGWITRDSRIFYRVTI